MKNSEKIKKEKKTRRHARIRAKISGTKKKPRLFVFRSLKHISAQLIDDVGGHTIATVSDAVFGSKKAGKGKTTTAAQPKDLGGKTPKVAIAYEVGKLISAKAKELGVEAVVFDRGGYKYHGRIKAVADGAREGGLKF